VAKAAGELRVTPSAVSHQLKALQDLLGVKLLATARGGALLTADGDRFASELIIGMTAIRAAYQRIKPGRVFVLEVNPLLALALRIGPSENAPAGEGVISRIASRPAGTELGAADAALRLGARLAPPIHHRPIPLHPRGARSRFALEAASVVRCERGRVGAHAPARTNPLHSAAALTDPAALQRASRMRPRRDQPSGNGAKIMDKAAFEIIGNVGSVEIKAIKGGKKLAVLSVTTSERWKRDNGDWAEKTLWHRVAVFGGPPPRGDSRADAQDHVERIEAQVQKGTRVRLVGQVRPASYDDANGVTRYTVEFVVGPFGDVEILARAKPREADGPAAETSQLPRAKRGKATAAGDVEATA
jgi:single-strand DNA-binding protein